MRKTTRLTLLLLILTSFSYTGINYQKPYKKNDFVKIIRKYGMNMQYPILGQEPSFYNGIIFQLKENAPILSIQKGTVLEINNSSNNKYGKYIILKHKGDLIVKYYHLNKINVSLNQKVKTGDIIAISGMIGFATVNCLGFQVEEADSLVNPIMLFNN